MSGSGRPIVLVGDLPGPESIAPRLENWGWQVRSRDSLPTAPGSEDLICVVLNHPDQYSSEEVNRFLASAGVARVVCVLQPWSVSVGRTRSFWPLAVLCSPTQLEQRLMCEVEVLEGRLAPLPVTAGREEVMEWMWQSAPSRVAGEPVVQIQMTNRACRETLKGQLEEAGCRVDPLAGADPSSACDLVIADLDEMELAGGNVQTWRTMCSSPAVLLLHSRPDVPDLTGLDRTVAASKFDPVASWFRLLSQAGLLALLIVLAGCKPSDSVKPEPALTTVKEPTGPAWEELIAQVRAGKRKTVITERTVSAAELAELKTGCEAIEVLELFKPAFEEDQLSVLASLTALKRLRYEGPLSDQGIEYLLQCPSLRQVNLTRTTVTDAGLAKLATLPLTQLRLRSRKVTDEGIKAIGGIKELRFLHLIEVPLTDASLPVLAGIDSLESLYLDGGRCTEEALSALLRQRPDIHFHRDQLHLEGDPNADGH